jgi:hypothetical protein
MFNFLGIGAQKAGTTWLFQMLKQHPEIGFPIQKEAHYWNRKYPDTPVEKYLANFQDPKLIEGEITPAYAFLDIDTISLIHQYNPELKLVYLIRNPIDRAWSSAKMALARAEMELAEASDQWFIDHFNSKGSLLRGDYQQCISNWREVFDEQQLLVLNFDDIQRAPEKLLNDCCNHLSVPPFNPEQLETMDIHERVFSTTKQLMNDRLYSHLSTLYSNKINDLQEYLAIDLSYWLLSKD